MFIFGYFSKSVWLIFAANATSIVITALVEVVHAAGDEVDGPREECTARVGR